MGMVGCYDAHFYCDCCNKFAQSEHVETYEEAINAMQEGERSWLFRPDGLILCSVCKILKNPTLIPEANREGYEWNWKKAEAVPEGFLLVPKELSDKDADEQAMFSWCFNFEIFKSQNRDMTAIQVQQCRDKWCLNKARSLQQEYRNMIEAQEQGHDS